jgi:outer membrane protein assembly complex protein YaeT
VATRIVIREGVQTRVGAVSFEGNAALTDDELRALAKVAPGAVFFAPAVAADRDTIHLEYLNRGYAAAAIAVEPVFAADKSRTDLAYRIAEGPRIIVDHVIVVGNTKTSEETIRRELLVEAGKPLALEDVIESQRRLSALGLFRRVRITEVPHEEEPRRDIIVSVEEADRTTVAYGGGLEAAQRTVLAANGTADERLEVAPRGSFEIGRRNLWGRNRSVNFFTRVSFRPRGESIASPESANYGFNEYRVVGTYREIGAFGRLADVAVNGFVEQAIRSSFNFSRRGINAEAQRRVSPFVRFTARYSFGRTRLFDERIAEEERLDIDRVFSQVRLSSFSLSVYRDTRDDPLDPGRGWLLGSDSELAARSVGSQVGFAKTYVQALGFRTLSRTRHVVLASAVRLGLARGFEQNVNGQLVVDDLPASERFFAGGSTTVRGFALDKLGARDTISAAGFAIGGNALLVLNAEIRTPLWRDVGAVAFLDAGNVFARVSNIDAGGLRVSPGFGLRYRSPIGPIRVDLGFKLGRRELSPGNFEGLTAFHISVGHAF